VLLLLLGFSEYILQLEHFLASETIRLANMSAPDASEIRRVLQVYDQTSNMPVRQAVGMLQGITSQIAKSPAAYDLLADAGMCVGVRWGLRAALLRTMQSSSAPVVSCEQPTKSLQQQQQQQQSQIHYCTGRGSSSPECTCVCSVPARAPALSAQADQVCVQPATHHTQMPGSSTACQALKL
jgi:hypothetical protein